MCAHSVDVAVENESDRGHDTPDGLLEAIKLDGLFVYVSSGICA